MSDRPPLPATILSTLHTEYGRFSLKVGVVYHHRTHEKIFTINLGSETRKCIQLSVVEGAEHGKLIWVEAHEECSLERYIEKGLAQHMTLLGLTIARVWVPTLKTVELDDMSSFKCDVPNKGAPIQVPMKPFYIAFHGGTWYETLFDAKRRDGRHEEYLEKKKNLYRPTAKPEEFDFINADLQDALDPLYHSTSTWWEFFQAINKTYGRKKCAMVYPWIGKAMSTIFGSSMYEDTAWMIDLEENKKKNKTAMITYREGRAPTLSRGGTRKKRPCRRFTFKRTHLFPQIREIQEWNYKRWIRSIHK